MVTRYRLLEFIIDTEQEIDGQINAYIKELKEEIQELAKYDRVQIKIKTKLDTSEYIRRTFG